MPSTSNVLDEARDLVMKRLAELDEERKRLERALAELGGQGARPPPRPPARLGLEISRLQRRPGDAGGAAAAPAPIRRSRWSRKTPASRASEIAKTMKIKPNYLYRVLGDLEKEGRVKKKGRSTTTRPEPAARAGLGAGSLRQSRPSWLTASRSSAARRRWRRSGRARSRGSRGPRRPTTRRRSRCRAGRRRCPPRSRRSRRWARPSRPSRPRACRAPSRGRGRSRRWRPRRRWRRRAPR